MVSGMNDKFLRVTENETKWFHAWGFVFVFGRVLFLKLCLYYSEILHQNWITCYTNYI